MSTREGMTDIGTAGEVARHRLVADLPVEEKRLDLAGVSTALLEGGAGRALVLLHGPGEFAEGWMQVLPDLARDFRVIAPDLPGHGGSVVTGGPMDADRTIAWLGELIGRTCPKPPVLVGRTLGGAVALRFAVANPSRIAGLVLVDTFGLQAFRPAPEFGQALADYVTEPTPNTFDALMRLCSHDLDRLRDRLGQLYPSLVDYAVDRARDPQVRTALAAAMQHFAGPIPPSDLERIGVPTTLVWGRHDLATPLRAAEEARARYGWPLHVIDGAADDPTLDQPAAFVATIRAVVSQQV